MEKEREVKMSDWERRHIEELEKRADLNRTVEKNRELDRREREERGSFRGPSRPKRKEKRVA